MNLIEFLPRIEGPLVVELIDYLRNHEGLTMTLDWGVWDFVSSTEGDEGVPQLAIKSVRNSIPSPTVEALSRSPIPLKLILVEGANPNIESLKAQGMLLSSSGVGVYVRNFGWVTLPSKRTYIAPEELALIKARKWRKNDDGEWVKRCRTCKSWKGVTEYYKIGGSKGVDPYRGQCRACENAARTERYRNSAQKGLTK